MRRFRLPAVLSLAIAAIAALAAIGAAAQAARAQAYNYPSFQPPVLAEREYNFLAASASRAGTSLVAQWRESMSPKFQFTLEGGLAAPAPPAGAGADTRLVVGGALAWQLVRENAEFPFDAALTAGAGLSTGNSNTVIRVPFGVVLGMTVALEEGRRLTPFVHPRLSLDSCSSCLQGRSDDRVNVDVDIGASLVLSDQVALSIAALFGGANYLGATNAVGVAVAWTPRGVRK